MLSLLGLVTMIVVVAFVYVVIKNRIEYSQLKAAYEAAVKAASTSAPKA